MKKIYPGQNRRILVPAAVAAGLVCLIFGCGQLNTASSGDLTKASSDLTKVASGLQSSSGNTSKSTEKSGGVGGTSQPTSVFGVFGLLAQAVPNGWDASKTITNEAVYTWTSSTGAVVTEESSIYMRYLDANGVQLAPNRIVSWEITPTVNFYFLAKKQQIVQNITGPSYSGYLTLLATLPINFALPLTMSLTAEGWFSYSGTVVSTFEITALNMDLIVANASGGGSASGSMTWGYNAPGTIEAYYYGTVDLSINSLGSNPAGLTGDVYQDLTADNVRNGVKIGTITFTGSNWIKITLDNGAVIYAGEF